MRRWALRLGMAAGLAVATSCAPAQAGYCAEWWTTGYVRGDGNPYTADGTSIWTDENIAAAVSLPFDSKVWVEGYGVYRIADRGHLGANHIDLAVWTLAEAYEATGWRTLCVLE